MTTAVPSTIDLIWVVPCFNEAHRLDVDAFASLVRADSRTGLLFVNDGSTDGTGDLLQRVAALAPDRVEVLSLPQNAGKAEAVRCGLQRALARDVTIVGYADADLATPVSELQRLAAVFATAEVDALLASRVALLGRHIERRAIRHYLGRVFSTAASLALSLPVYDTQCGAKLFRRTEALTSALATPFVSRWVFDVELIGRLLTGAHALPRDRIVEEPLLRWRDVAGSSLGWWSMLRSAIDLARIALTMRRATVR